MLWAAESTTAADRQHIIRFLIERIVVDVQGASERVVAEVAEERRGHDRHPDRAQEAATTAEFGHGLLAAHA